jgi:membrane-associated phospholipid phosphatase
MNESAHHRPARKLHIEPPRAVPAATSLSGLPRPLSAGPLQVWFPPLLLALAGVAALWVDVPLALHFRDGERVCTLCTRFHPAGATGHIALEHIPSLLKETIEGAECFGHGSGVAIILLACFLLDVQRRPFLPRIGAACGVASLLANVLKMVVARTRPGSFGFQSSDFADTFGQWLPLLSTGSPLQSFPSAHTASATALAVTLSWLYPRGRWLFAFLAVLVGMQRIQGAAHFLSDVAFGAAAGWLAALLVLRVPPFSTLFGAFERWRSSAVAGCGAGLSETLKADLGETRTTVVQPTTAPAGPAAALGQDVRPLSPVGWRQTQRNRLPN